MKNVYCIEEDSRDPNKRWWRQVGVAFENQDGSLNLKLYMFPGVDLQVREQSTPSDGQRATNNGAHEQRTEQRGQRGNGRRR